MKKWLGFALWAVVVAGCKSTESAVKVEEPVASAVATQTGEKAEEIAKNAVDLSKPVPPGVDEKILDPKVGPCDDFYRHACGGWLDTTEIPADRANYTRGFVAISDRTDLALKELLDQAAAGKLPANTPWAKQLGDYYGSCTDEAALEKSLPELKKQLAKLGGAKNAKGLAAVLGDLHEQGIFPLFAFGSQQDFKDSSQVIAAVDQGGLGLPDRDYYLKDDPKMLEVRKAYAEHVTKMFELLGEKPEAAKKSSETVMALETQLAQASLDRVARREPNNIYHPVGKAGLAKAAPTLPWTVYFQSVGAPATEALSVTHLPFVEEIDKLAKATPAATWKTYFTWNVLRASVQGLPKSFRDEAFRFQSTALTGAKAELPRWKKCVNFTEGALGEALGQAYVSKHFGPQAKEVTLDLVKRIGGAFEKNLAAVDWMDDATRAKAADKVRRMVNKIGYPDKWRDYSALKTQRTSFLANLGAARDFEMKFDLAKIGKPVDRYEWLMSPSAVNAYYMGTMNEIVFPAGILQAPIFDLSSTMPVNFGGMGMVVGHEITHGFDDKGRKFDADGNLNDWWSAKAGPAFEKRAECVKKQYDGYTAVDEVKLNGALTLGENTADLGGMKLAFAAMQQWVAEHPQSGVKGFRFTPEQQFFYGLAQMWCGKYRPEASRVRAQTDPHSPPQWRVNGPLYNFKPFREAFSCKADSPMAKAQPVMCEVW
jgi:putative endopeptidase